MTETFKFSCPYLEQEVELSQDREQHIAASHPDLLPEHRQSIIETLADPDEIRRSKRFVNALLFSHWFADLKGGKYVVVVVVSEGGIIGRHWIVTAYIARKLAEGDVVWKRN